MQGTEALTLCGIRESNEKAQAEALREDKRIEDDSHMTSVTAKQITQLIDQLDNNIRPVPAHCSVCILYWSTDCCLYGLYKAYRICIFVGTVCGFCWHAHLIYRCRFKSQNSHLEILSIIITHTEDFKLAEDRVQYSQYKISQYLL